MSFAVRDRLCNWLGFTFLWRLQALHRREEGQERRGIFLIICFCYMSFLGDISSIDPQITCFIYQICLFWVMCCYYLLFSAGIEHDVAWFIRMVLTFFDLSILALCLIVIIIAYTEDYWKQREVYLLTHFDSLKLSVFHQYCLPQILFTLNWTISFWLYISISCQTITSISCYFLEYSLDVINHAWSSRQEYSWLVIWLFSDYLSAPEMWIWLTSLFLGLMIQWHEIFNIFLFWPRDTICVPLILQENYFARSDFFSHNSWQKVGEASL